MKLSQISTIDKTKYLASMFFILVGLLSLLDSLYNKNYFPRDLVILIVLSLPLIINKRLFYLGYGILSSLITLPMTIIYIAFNNPIRSTNSLSFFILGLVLFLLAIISSLALIYVGTYTKERNRFRIV